MIPPLTKKKIDEYAETGAATGHFITAVLENDLHGAFSHADTTNLENLGDIVKYVWTHIPHACWGSKEAVKEWREMGGMKGWREKNESS